MTGRVVRTIFDADGIELLHMLTVAVFIARQGSVEAEICFFLYLL